MCFMLLLCGKTIYSLLNCLGESMSSSWPLIIDFLCVVLWSLISNFIASIAKRVNSLHFHCLAAVVCQVCLHLALLLVVSTHICEENIDFTLELNCLQLSYVLELLYW
jgi:hypothetical protein